MHGTTELRTVALKLFGLATDGSGSQGSGSGSYLSSNSESQRILEEGRALCRVEHPNVVRFHSIASDPAHDSIIGLAMEYLDGIAGLNRDTRDPELPQRNADCTAATGSGTASQAC